MKELVLKKRSELEEICRKTHLIAEVDTSIEYAIEAIESGTHETLSLFYSLILWHLGNLLLLLM